MALKCCGALRVVKNFYRKNTKHTTERRGLVLHDDLATVEDDRLRSRRVVGCQANMEHRQVRHHSRNFKRPKG